MKRQLSKLTKFSPFLSIYKSPMGSNQFSTCLIMREQLSSKLDGIHFRTSVKIGEVASIKRSFSSQDVSDFARLSGDYNPLHFNAEFAKTHGMFKDRIVHGVLVSSLISNLAGTVLPGAGSIYMSQELKFLKPVYIDQEVTVFVQIKEGQSTRKSGDKKVIFILDAEVRDSKSNDLLAAGTSRLYHPNLTVEE